LGKHTHASLILIVSPCICQHGRKNSGQSGSEASQQEPDTNSSCPPQNEVALEFLSLQSIVTCCEFVHPPWAGIMHLTYRDSDPHTSAVSPANAGEAGAPENAFVVPNIREALFPGLKVPEGLTFGDLCRAAEMVLDWQDGHEDDYRGLFIAAKLYEYLRAADSTRSDTRSGTG
jgi:hypothetical protein